MEAFAEYFEEMLSDLSPARRKVISKKVGQQLRRSNQGRIRKNVEPDGGAMEPRKQKYSMTRGGKKIRSGKMFRNLPKAKYLRVYPEQDEVTIGIGNPLASLHHYGKEMTIGRTKSGARVRHKYAARRLLGFDDEDIGKMTDTLLEWMSRD
ncbi:phage virion morphogenesis protein [uncultured Croceicoccus sp.]|uniref:phage virion morphogenesis protein n=1 Tax=uncultured Croceicoccus sp. TaxID=1295329 RepID=UPI00263344A3|nr:phage virion morphogenesis protein [uncultured Croceicoccus sp.]